ncbi:MAG: hypothetical protein WAN36_10955, partial [Calditrichia bacterium]
MGRKNAIKLAMAAFTAGLLVFASCQKKPAPFKEIVARVEDEYLTRDQLKDWLPPNLPQESRNLVAHRYIERWVQKTALAKMAEKENMSLNDYEEWTIHNFHKNMLAEKYLEKHLPQEVSITDEEIKEYYQNNREEFKRTQPELHLVQLYLEKLDQAISREIQNSNNLLQVIQKNYLEASSDRM